MQRRQIAKAKTSSSIEARIDQWGGIIRKKVKERLETAIPGSSARAVASALLIGDKSLLDRKTKAAFRNAGISHTLALSGMHVGAIWGMVCLFFSVLNWNYRTKSAGIWLSCAVIFLYAICTGLSPSVSRACIMLSVWKTLQATGSSEDRLGPLLVSAMVIVLFNTLAVDMPSFQLSYAAVLGIVFIYPAFEESIDKFLKPRISTGRSNSGVLPEITRMVRNALNSLASGLLKLGGITLSCQMTTFPLILLYFGKTSGIFMLANIVAAPLVTLSVYGSVAAALLCDIPYLGDIICKVSSQILEFMQMTVLFLGF